MKAMKLYDRVERIHNELALLEIDGTTPLTVEQLTPFDQYHYFGTEAVDEAIVALGLSPGMRVLDIGSGIGGPARYIAARSGARVTALELQPDLDELATDLTQRCGLAHLVEHRCGDVLDGLDETYDAVVSFLCFLHIADLNRLLAACRDALTAGGGMYIEDFAKRREPTRAEAAALEIKVQCPPLPSPDDYTEQLRAAGFTDLHIEDVTSQWGAFTAGRLEEFRASRARNIAVHGLDIVDGLDDFYGTVARLFETGVITGLKILAR
ncbi:MAG TPA: methyltransferase domain-containing protein [Ilumatobacteraceae bacterium]|nr:methyltransferase domain-containing protein [Ilumatobacteraceae bacterium]